MVIYFICCIAFEIETLIIPRLGTADISLFALMFLVTSVFVGVYLPVQYKLGYEKTRFIFMVVIIASPIILPLFMRMESLNMDFLSTLSPYLICVSIIFVGLVVLAISASLSMKIYEKTDLA
jgi:ABC-2 type transport system permease protein